MTKVKHRILSIIESHRLLFAFLFRDGWNLLREVASAWDNPKKIEATAGTADTPITQYFIKRDVVDRYNERYDQLKLQLRGLVHNRGHFGRAYLVPLFVIRVCTVIAAAMFGFLTTFLVSALQFIVAPYSFFAAFAAWVGMLPVYVVHFAFFAVLQTVTWSIYSHYPVVAKYLRVPITPMLIVGWVVVDQLICTVLCFWTPIGRPVHRSPKRLLQSIGYGFLNCKTYWLVLLLALRGFHIDVLALSIYAVIPSRLKARAARVFKPVLPAGSLHSTFQGAMFYHYHRMVHLPGAYNEGHRHHHYLPDATPFDAHMHGSGMPEEWFKLMTEISICLLTGLMPWSFTLSAIRQSLGNKLGHTRIQGTHPILDNFHVNHHEKHFKNFGFAGFALDLLMGTEFGDVSRLGNIGKAGVRCTKHTYPAHYVLEVAPTEQEIGASAEIEVSASP